MELDEFLLKKEYSAEKSLETLLFGKIFSIGSLIIISLISVVEYLTYHMVDLLYCRLILIITSATFMLLSFKVFKNKTHLILPFHILNLLGAVLMITGLAIVKTHNEYLRSIFNVSSLSGGIVTVIFILFIFSSGSGEYLGYIILIPVIALIGYFVSWGKISWVDISFLVNPLITGIGACILKIFHEKLQYQEFKTRKLLEKTKDLLETEINEKNILEEKLRNQATFDELTGVFNRRAGLELLKAKCDTYKLILCYIDLDNLKEVNDIYGHTIGDNMILIICNAIRNSIREDDFIFRVGGDEFIVVFNNCTNEEVEVVMGRIKQKLKETDFQYKIDFSYGISQHVTGKSNINQVIENADRNMYQDKIRKKSSSY